MISILYVDDESALLDIAKLFLERTGEYHVDTATSVPQALDLIRKNSYEAIISDYQMPDTDGIAFLKILRKDYPSLPFIIFTGKGREEIAVEAFENGADFYLQKGGQPKAQFSELLKKVESAVRRRRAENSLKESEEKYRNLIERATDGIVVLQDSKIRYCNQHSADFIGYSIPDVTGKLFTDFVAPEELPQLQKNYERRMAGEKFPGTYETVLIRKDGSRIFAELNAGLVDYEGKPADMLIIRDITQRKQMEEELQKKNADLHAALEKLHQQDAVLHKNEEKFRMIFDTAPSLILSVNRDGIIVDANQRVRDVLGYEKREINGKSLAMILFPDDQVTAKDCLGESMTIGAVYNRHVRMVKKDGQLIDVSINATGIKDQSGRYFRTVCIIDDVTARFAADELLRRREEKFRMIFDTAMTLIASITLDGTIVDCNQRIQDVLGYSKAEIIGQPISLIIHPEDIEQARDSFVQIQKTGVYYDKHFRMIRKDGMIIRVSINATAIKDRHDKYFRVICIIEDITARLQAEETLRITQEKFSKAFHAAPDAIVISDLISGQIIECNDAASVIFGYTHEELIGHSARELKILKNDEDRHALIWRVKTQGRVEQFELVERRKSGKLFNASITADTVTMGDTPYLITIVRDVTERTRTEEALRASDARYKDVVEDQTECIARFLPDGTYVFVNEAFLRYFHTTREAIIGHRLSLDIPEEDQKIIREHFLALTRENPVATVVHRIQKEGGAIVWLRWSDRAIFDPNGTLIEYQSVGRDITEQKLVEEALRNSDETMRGIINHLPDPTFVINTKGEVVAWNKAMEDLTGVRRKDMVGKKEYEYALPFYGKRIPILIDLTLHYDEESKKKYVYVRREGETLVAETIIAHPREKSFVLWGKASPLYDKDGKLSGAIETIRDITERKQEEIRLNHAVRQLNLLTSVTRHDILNQLLALKGYLDLSHEYLDRPGKIREFLLQEEIIASVIENQINLTREYEEVGTKAPVWQDVNRCIGQATAALPMRGVKVTVDTQDLELYADPLFEKVIYNLIDNALRYGGNALTEIRISANITPDHLVLLCEDDGAGVPENERSHLFERGFGKHTGLGLFLSKEILSITKIGIRETGSSGTGACFELTVPAGAYRFGGGENKTPD